MDREMGVLRSFEVIHSRSGSAVFKPRVVRGESFRADDNGNPFNYMGLCHLAIP